MYIAEYKNASFPDRNFLFYMFIQKLMAKLSFFKFKHTKNSKHKKYFFFVNTDINLIAIDSAYIITKLIVNENGVYITERNFDLTYASHCNTCNKTYIGPI